MNKKFSTLLATLLVAGGMSSAFAAITAPTVNVTTLEAGKSYQLYNGTDGRMLIMKQAPDGTFKAVFEQPANVSDLASTLWTISYNDNVVNGPDFTLVNKGTKCPLSVDLSKVQTTATSVTMGGNVSSWKWLPIVSDESSYLHKAAFCSYFKVDSVVYLSYNSSTYEVEAAKELATKWSSSSNLIEVKPVEAAAYALTAEDLNTKLGTDPEGTSFKLSADPELTDKLGEEYYSTLGNMFTDSTFRAWNASDNNTTPHDIFVLNTWRNQPGEHYVFLQMLNEIKDDDKFNDTYLVADTNYIDGTATNLELVKFTSDTLATGIYSGETYFSAGADGRNSSAYLFEFLYYPTADSIAINVKGYNKKAASSSNYNNRITAWTQVEGKETVIINQLTASNEVTLFDIPAGQGANVRFWLGDGTTNRTSKPNWVYTITNDKGQYLAVPIQNTENTSNNGVQWVTLSEQEALNMPAYQWVVLKNNDETEEIANVSPVRIINREFYHDAEFTNVQLRQEEGGEYLFVTGGLVNVDSLKFNEVPQTVLENKYLGYMNIEEDELDVMNYNLNYLNPYVADKYIGLNGNDTILTVKEAITSFYFEKGTEEKYGYQADGTEGIDGLVESLVRFQYTPYVKTADGERYIGMDKEDRYFVAPSSTTKKNFYFKENNYYQPEGVEAARPYYALVDLTAGSANNQVSKAGTSDMDMAATLRNQVMSETRTSAFAVVPNDAPLYRRFNSVELDGAVAGEKDATKILRFKESYRGEYLMDENNPNFQNEGVTYLGIDDASKATGLSFYVDTAVLNGSKAGHIKPQYFIYLNREVVAEVPGDECKEEGNHYDENGNPTDAAHCVHATPGKAGYTVAEYFVSFQDSVDQQADNFEKAMGNIANDDAYAINAAHAIRSKYALNIVETNAPTLDKLVFEQNDEKVLTTTDLQDYSSTSSDKKVKVGVPVQVLGDREKAVYDIYLEVAPEDAKFNVTFDQDNHTFTIGQNPDWATIKDVTLDVIVWTAEIDGTINKTTVTVALDSEFSTATEYQPITHNVAVEKDEDNVQYIDLQTMKDGFASTDDLNSWIKNVNLDGTEYQIFTDEECEDQVTFSKLDFDITDKKDYAVAAQTGAKGASANYVRMKVYNDQVDDLKLDEQYYLKVTFKDAASNTLNSFVVPITFTAPSVAEQFVVSTNYQNGSDKAIKGYYNNWTATNTRKIDMKHFFKSYDKGAALTLDDEAVVTEYKALGELTSNDLATLSATGVETALISLNTQKSTANDLVLDDDTNREVGYGKVLTINATNNYYADTQWAYTDEADTKTTLTITILSPIYEGVIAATDGSKNLSVVVNNEGGAEITNDMINLTDYANNKYNVVPDAKGTAYNNELNTSDGTATGTEGNGITGQAWYNIHCIGTLHAGDFGAND